MVGIVQLSTHKYLLWTNYTYSVLDLQLDMPQEVQIHQDHPNKSSEAKHLEADGWFDMLKISQKKYL